MAGNVDGGWGPVPDVAGKVAVITGASRGIGAGLAARFAERGMAVGLCARSAPPVPPGAADRTIAAAVDVTEASAVDDFTAAVADTLGPIHLWVNNAGVLAPIGPLRDADPAELDTHVRVNVLGVLLGSRAYARHVRSRPGGGALVNVSSGAATSAYPGWAAYCGSKAAVDQLTRVIAVEEADARLRAWAVAPGVVDTGMHTMIRATPAERFPPVERFHRLARENAFNSPAWVADHLLALAFAPTANTDDWRSEVVLRVPDEPRA